MTKLITPRPRGARLNKLNTYNLFDLHGAEAGGSPGGMQTRIDAIPGSPGSPGRTIDGQPFADIWTELQARLAAFNQTASALTAMLSYQVERAQDRVAVPTTHGFEQATELGRPAKGRVKYVYRGFPIDHYDTGLGYTQEFLDLAKSSEIMAAADQVETDWTAHVNNTVLSALFNDTNSTGYGPDGQGVSVVRLYNADGEVPPKWKRNTHDGTHTHYLESAGATLAVADMTTLENHLAHHGFLQGRERGFVFANLTELDDIRGFTGFVPASTATIPTIVDGMVVGQTSPANVGPFPVEGYIGKLAVVQEDDIPSGYLLAMASGGAFNPTNVVGVRVHENPSARGLRLIEGPRQNYPIYDSVYDGYVGAGVRQRGAAVVMQVTAGSYAVPTFD